MKYLYITIVFFISVTSLFAQEFISNSTIHFKDSSVVSGDFYYYPTLPQNIIVIDSLKKKQAYNLALIDYIHGKGDLYRVIDFNGSPKLFDAIIEGERISLYKTNFNDDIQFYVLKDGKMSWLEGGEKEIVMEDIRYRKDNYKYKGTLKFLFNDNSYVLNKLDKIIYIENDIAPLIIAYNNGHITYIKTKDIEKQNRMPAFKIYGQYSRGYHIPIFNGDEQTLSRFFQAGAQYYITEESRHSFKFGFEYGQLDGKDRYEGHWMSFNTSYYYDFLRKPYGDVYFGVKLIDVGTNWGSKYEGFYIYPRLATLLGYEHHITKKLDMYLEANHLLFLTTIPLNFTFGVSYDL